MAVFHALAPVLVQALGGLWSPALVLAAGSGLGVLAMAATLIAWPPRTQTT